MKIKVESILPDGTVEDVSDHVDPSDPVLWLADVLGWVRMGQHIRIEMQREKDDERHG